MEMAATNEKKNGKHETKIKDLRLIHEDDLIWEGSRR
tara:strand:+ start:779 stop:889 length:111 start_codon:yes stop_codon:yes gene_type:complete